MNIALIGSGGREHAFAYKLSQSPKCNKLFIIPGNAGTLQYGQNVPLNPLDFAIVGKFCLDNDVKLLVVGPEEPLVKGMRDHFEADHQLSQILFVGPGQAGAAMEGSKDWSKAFMQKYGIPTAKYKTFSRENIIDGMNYIRQHSLPVVLKADGLAAGKGVLICESTQEAVAEIQLMIEKSKFGSAGSKVVVEEFLKGIELSVFVLTDGEHYIVLPEAKDYKRIGEGETGLNTGGMGAISPVPFADERFMQKVTERIIKPTIAGLKSEKISYKGFIFIGLMKVDEEPFVIEYNCRMGDPETEVVLPRIETDFVQLMESCAKGELHSVTPVISDKYAATVMLVSGGYPGDYEKGKVIKGLDHVEGSIAFHAGTAIAEGETVTSGGRVIAVTTLAAELKQALERSKKNASHIQFEGKYFRKDIGFEFI